MTVIKVYALRQRGTDKYMPANPPSKHRQSYSVTEPETNGGSQGPRLFPSIKSATNSRTAWMRGMWVMAYEDQVWGEGYWYPELKPIPARSNIELELVEFELKDTGRPDHTLPRTMEVADT